MIAGIGWRLRSSRQPAPSPRSDKAADPQTEHAARPQLRGQPLETLGVVEGGIPRMEQKVRRMIDVDQYGVEAAARRVRVEARAGFR